MSVRCQRCSAIGAEVSDPHNSGWQEMTCVASCFDGEETWLCNACADALRPNAAPKRKNERNVGDDVEMPHE